MMGFSIIFRVLLLTTCFAMSLSQRRFPARRWPFLGRFSLDKACRTVGPNQQTLTEKACPSCGTCSNGPVRTRVNNTLITAYFCRYRNPFRNIQQRACLIQNDATNALIKMRNCGLRQQCTLGPAYMSLPNNTSGRLYFCSGKQPNIQRRPIIARPRTQPNLFQIMVNESCVLINTSAGSLERKSCCQNCTGGPITIIMDSHRLQLYYCLDYTSNFTAPNRPKPARPVLPRWGRGGQGGWMGGLGGRLGGMVGGRQGRQPRPPVRVGPVGPRAGRRRMFGK